MTTAPYTQFEMLEEIRAIVFQWARVNAAIFGRHAGYSVLSLPLDIDEPEIKDPLYNVFHQGTKVPIEFDLESLNIAKQMTKLYHYGVQGQRTIYFDGIEDGTDESAVCNFIHDATASKAAPDISQGEAIATEVCEYVVQVATARSILDGHERYFSGDGPKDLLTLSEIALLAGLDERTVRNATAKGASNRLLVTNVGPNVYVHRDAARNWLASKKGFLPTQLNLDLSDDNLELRHFRRPHELGSYLRALRKKQRLSVDSMTAAVGAAVDARQLSRMEGGDLDVDPELLIKIAKALHISNPEKFADYAQALQKIAELEALKQRLGGLWPANPLHLNEMLRSESE